ncbi:MAG: hypothetical protein U0802_12970 [Candidatus Binatia bacterium]
MTWITKLVLAAAVLGLVGVARADDGGPVKIKKWKADAVELFDKPDGTVVATRPAAELPMDAVRTGQGWLKVTVGGKAYFVDASQARTDLKLTGKPKCDSLGGATGHAASRGLGEEGCEP